MKKFLLSQKIFLVLALVLAAISSEIVMAQEEAIEIKVKPGDSLQSISLQIFGTNHRWREILEANRSVLSDPKKLSPGMVLRVPATQAVAVESSKSAEPKNFKTNSLVEKEEKKDNVVTSLVSEVRETAASEEKSVVASPSVPSRLKSVNRRLARTSDFVF